MSALRDAARDYAAAGVPVFPIHSPGPSGCSCGNPDCANIGKHPRTRNGLHDATPDVARVDAYWRRRPEANIGAPTGPASGRFVVDIDARAGGYESADALQAHYGLLPATLAVTTGGGGLHLHYAWPAAGVIRNSAGKLGPGLDVRGDGGYVLLPPSRHRSGSLYAWAGLDDATDIAPAPGWLLALVAERPPEARSKPNATPDEGPIPEGQRNSTLTRAAGAIRRHGLSEAEILAALERMNADRCRPPLDDAEVVRIARSVAGYAPSASLPAPRQNGGYPLPSGAILACPRGGRHGR